MCIRDRVKTAYARSNRRSLGNHVVSPEEEKERLQWEGFNRERKSADTVGTVLVPGLAISSAKILISFFSKTKYPEAILSNSTPKLLRFEISDMLIAV